MRGIDAAQVMSYIGLEAMNQNLVEISANVTPGAVAFLILDGAGRHSSPELAVPDNIVLMTLPPYAPELNPAENIWQYHRCNALVNSVWDTHETILDARCHAWKSLITQPQLVASIGARERAQVRI